ncbi:TonB-dependent receptor [Algivirga pacifica]|uniref:TonB-dependent receptor n=1 Tax=Algivirga pacifica TaxID=1162670 RepID=A0ABP9DH52_9BACT
MIALIAILFSALPLWAQTTHSIQGTISDESGISVPGASIQVKGTTQGTVTDMNGHFQLNLNSETATLLVSFIGYLSQEVTVTPQQTRFDITLKTDIQQLEEVVVIGYGTQKKSDLSSAVSTVKAEEANKLAAASPAQMLQGRTSGVSVISGSAPGAAPYIKIRGLSSFGDVQPLYVIDGIPGGDISMLSPDDIASFEILKDGAAAAIYGSLAANGVVLITTKSGKNNQPTRVDVNLYAGIQEAAAHFPMANAQEWYNILEQSYNNSIADGALTEANKPLYLQAGSGFDLSNYADTDWQQETLRQGRIQNYSVGISGGSENSNYNLSMNYFDQEGVVINTGSKRYNFRYKSSFEKGNLKVSPNIFYSHQTTAHNTIRMAYMLRSLPVVSVYDDSKESGYGYLNEFGIRSGANPVGQSDIIRNNSTRDQLQANLGLQYKLSDSFRLIGNAGYGKSFYKNRYFFPKYTLASDTRREDPYLSETRSEWSELNYDFTANYNTELGKHSIGAMAGIVGYRYDYRNLDMNVVGGAIFPDFGGLEPSFNSMQAGDFLGAGGMQTVTRFSVMSRINYNYDDKYLLQATVRTDGSSKFGANNRWGTFPSVSGAWKISNEDFFEGAKEVVNELKFRGSYGILGRETTLGAYSRQALVQSGYWYVWNNTPIGGIGSFEMANADLAWEEAETINIGVDAGFFEDKLFGTFNYYQNNSQALLMQEPNTPMSAGVSPPIVNLGTISNQGIEIELGYRGEAGDFQYSFTGNMTTIDNKVVELGSEEGVLPGGDIAYTGAQTFSKVGAPVSQFYMFKTNGVFQSQSAIDNYVGPEGDLIQPNAKPGDVIYVDVNGDGIIDSNDITDVGSPLPTLEYGLNASLSYKGLDLSLFFQGVYGNKILNVNAYESEAPNSGYNIASKLLDAWTPENPTSTIPRNVQVDNNNNYMMSDRFLEDGAYLRLKNIQLGYTLPSTVLEKVHFSKMRFYVNADNLWTLTNYQGFNPELVPANALTQGIDYGSYPMYQTITAGIQATF